MGRTICRKAPSPTAERKGGVMNIWGQDGRTEAIVTGPETVSGSGGFGLNREECYI